jgi:hypothetical protein
MVAVGFIPRVDAKDLDKKFDAGEDISRYVEIDKARRPSRTSNELKEPRTDKSNKVPSE